ncbi:MAG TPA: SufE family protein [Alphaproteobacteria bacterium]|nr:SufE family protein [Alphaproteobacteria bacterium]MCB9984822.1 SufE family protein [Micavibrio sp.]HPQ51137.1 SufE family protein [Alphaproteobacteria bacterium]HRK97214.1 SufE family protein [Alphaproteobacteria bacterium]
MRSIEEIIESFELMDDWEDRYRVLIDLGKILPELPDTLHRDEFLVKGCTSKVWMIPDVKSGKFTFQADSDAHIVRGLVAVLYVIFNNIPVTDILSVDVEEIFSKLGLDQNLSPNRRNGFFSMVEKIKAFGLPE